MHSRFFFLMMTLAMFGAGVSSVTGAMGLSDINADEVLNSQCKDSACTAQAKHPAQTRYYTTSNDHLGEAQIAADAALTEAGKQQLSASDFKAQANHRKATAEVPDLTDPALMRLGDFVQHSPTLMNGISDKYHDCKGGGSYQYATQTRQCFRATNNAITTTMSRVHTGNTTQTRTLTLHPNFGNETYRFSLPVSSAVITKVVFKLDGGRYISSWSGGRHDHGSSTPACRAVTLTFNHHALGSMGGGGSVLTWDRTYRLNLALSSSSVTLSLLYKHACEDKMSRLMGSTPATVALTYQTTTPVTGWKTNSHDTQLRAAGCSPRPMVCTRHHETRTIAGVPVTEACWEKTQTWQCPSQNTCQTLPISPLDKMHMSAGQTSCQPQGQACQTRIQGVCIAQRETYRCTTKTQKDDELVCGAPGSVVCPPNSAKPECQPPRYTTNTSMVEALKGLALQKAITDEFDPKSLTFFSGDAKMCAKGALGTFDCCSSHEGWAGKIGA
ncbi:conjugal transfer protein TraN, partial [Vibrio artabrorum]|uniref:conjugal transfer protein TraN n=1 Tax=Vibrio artabrorum TaxID=446374 RepID=UPI0035511035